MTDAADLLLENAEVHTLADPDETAAALAVRDGEIVAVDGAYDVAFLEGVETDVIDCRGRVVIPGFVDAHVHLENLGRRLVHADLSDATGPGECVERLAAAETDREWVLGFGYDESTWNDPRYLTREDLDRVSEDRPVAAVRVDMHTVSLNSVAVERLHEGMPDGDVETAGGEPTGVVVEDATEAVWDAIDPDYAGTRDLVTAALSRANELGVTCVHDMVRNSLAPRAYRDLADDDELSARVRINYWSDHVESVRDVGLATNAGGAFVRTGAIKTFTDGSLGARTARLSEPYADAPTRDDPGRDASRSDGDGLDAGTKDRDGLDAGTKDGAGLDDAETKDGAGPDDVGTKDHDARGQWVVDPDELAAIVDEADAAALQVTAHAIGDEAVEEAVSALEATADPAGARHRIEHAELATDDHLERMAEAGIVASMQPNFHRWAGEGGLYDRRLGDARRERTNRLRDVHEADVPLAFGSDCMPMDPLFGVHHAVNAPAPAQRLPVTEALRAYTLGGAYAGFDEDRLGTIEVGKRADLAVLEASPWDQSDRIAEIDVALTLVDGEVVYDGR